MNIEESDKAIIENRKEDKNQLIIQKGWINIFENQIDKLKANSQPFYPKKLIIQ